MAGVTGFCLLFFGLFLTLQGHPRACAVRSDGSPGLLRTVSSSRQGRHHLLYLFPGLPGRVRLRRRACGVPEALSPWQTPTSTPGSWAGVKETRTEEAVRTGGGETGAEGGGCRC